MKSVDHEKMRSHVDQHFILEECDITVNVCGYCGLSMTSEFCNSSLILYVSSGLKTKGTNQSLNLNVHISTPLVWVVR